MVLTDIVEGHKVVFFIDYLGPSPNLTKYLDHFFLDTIININKTRHAPFAYIALRDTDKPSDNTISHIVLGPQPRTFFRWVSALRRCSLFIFFMFSKVNTYVSV